MFIALVPLFVAIVGLLMWCLAANSKVSEIGKIMFFCGLLALMFSSARETIRIGAFMLPSIHTSRCAVRYATIGDPWRNGSRRS